MTCSIVGVVRDRLVGVVLEADLLAAPPAAVRGDQDLRAAVVDPARQRLRGEPAEHDRVRRADPGAGEHRDRQLRDHRHVDRDPVALRDARARAARWRPSELSRMQVRVGQRPGVAGLADPVVGDLVAEARLDVPVDAVVGDVELAAGEPLRERQIPLERRVERLRPGQPLARLRGPERLVVGLRLVVQGGRRVRLGANAGSGGNVRVSAKRFSISGPSWAWGSTLTVLRMNSLGRAILRGRLGRRPLRWSGRASVGQFRPTGRPASALGPSRRRV